ncbi:MAG: hypothetical protein ABI378_12535 [Chitinophagaceae bacterium]
MADNPELETGLCISFVSMSGIQLSLSLKFNCNNIFQSTITDFSG